MAKFPLKPGAPLERGPLVKQAQEALKLSPYGNFMRGAPVDGEYGPQTQAATKRAKSKLGFQPVDKSYGQLLHDVLTGKKPQTAEMKKRAAARRAASKKPKRVVPFIRPLKSGDRGDEVLALQLALRNFFRQHGLGQGPGKTGTFGPSTDKALKTFQKRRAVTADKPGVYGRATHKQLSAHYGPTALKLLVRVQKEREKTPLEDRRAAIVAVAMFLYNKHRYDIRYTQGGARNFLVNGKPKPPDYPRYGDCSSTVEWYYWVVGAPSPSGVAWGTFVGWTGSQIGHGRRVSSREARIADLIYYPGSSGAIGHVTIKVSATLCVSFGSEPVRLLSIWYREVGFAVDHLGG